MKKSVIFAICAFACYAMQAQCGGCPHHKQTECAKTTQTVKSDSVKVTKAVPADGRAKISTQNISTQSATTVKLKEEPKAVETNVKAIPAQKATIRKEENSDNNSAR